MTAVTSLHTYGRSLTTKMYANRGMSTAPIQQTALIATMRQRSFMGQNSIKTLPSTGMSPPMPIPAIKQNIRSIARSTDNAAPMAATHAKSRVFLNENNLPYLSALYPQM